MGLPYLKTHVHACILIPHSKSQWKSYKNLQEYQKIFTSYPGVGALFSFTSLVCSSTEMTLKTGTCYKALC